MLVCNLDTSVFRGDLAGFVGTAQGSSNSLIERNRHRLTRRKYNPLQLYITSPLLFVLTQVQLKAADNRTQKWVFPGHSLRK